MNLPELPQPRPRIWCVRSVFTPEGRKIDGFFRADMGMEYLEWAADAYQWLMLFERELDISEATDEPA
jgi:hypothetical protein